MLYTRDLESPESYIRWSFYHMISSALQRRVWLRPNRLTGHPTHNSLFCNLFVLLIGPPSTGKGRSIKQEISILKHPSHNRTLQDGRVVSNINVAADATTLEALYRRLAESVAAVKFPTNIDGKEGSGISAHCSCTFLVEELGILIRQKAQDTVSFLCGAFDCGDVTYDTKHSKTDKILNCWVSIIAGTYPEFIRDNQELIAQGLMSRIIIVYEDQKRFSRRFKGIGVDQQRCYDELLEHTKKLSTTTCGEVTFSKDADDYIERIYPTLDNKSTRINKDPRLDNYYGRKNIHLEKLAMVMHFSERWDSMEVGVESVVRAERELASVEVRMADAFKFAGKNLGYEVSLQIKRYVESRNKEGVSYRKLLLEFTRDLSKLQFDETLQIMITTGQLRNNNGLYFTS